MEEEGEIADDPPPRQQVVVAAGANEASKQPAQPRTGALTI